MQLVKLIRKSIISMALIALFSLLIFPEPGIARQDSTDVEVLLEESAIAMAELESFHFLITTPVGKTMLISEAELGQVEGDVVRPLAFHAVATVELGFISLELQAIGIGDRIWVSNPLDGGAFMEVADALGEELPPLTLLNPDQLILQALGLIENATIEGEETLDGTTTTVVKGQFDPGDVTFDGTPVIEEVTGVLDPLAVTLWIDSDQRVVQAEFAGALLPWEQGGGRIVRRVELSQFNEVQSILAPANS